MHAFSCLQTCALCSVWESFFLLVMSHKIIFLNPMHPSLRLPVLAPSLSINFFYFFSQLYVLASSLQLKLSFLRSALWWTSWPMLTVIHSATRQPTVASGLDRVPYIPMTVYRILSWWNGNGKLISERCPCRRCRLCGWQHSLTCSKANQPLSPLCCHLLVTVTPTNRLIKCVTVTQSHTYTGTQRHENIHTRQTNTWQVWVTAAYSDRTQQTKLSDRNVGFHNNAIKSHNDILQDVSGAIMLLGGVEDFKRVAL